MRNDNCIFCKIASGEIPSNTIFEDEDFRIILDAAPATKGHALIIPKEHYKDLYEIDENVAVKAFGLAKKMIGPMTEALHADGFNVLQNNKEVAGQTVFHFHMHLIPRYEGKDKILTWGHEEFSDEEMKKICESLKQ